MKNTAQIRNNGTSVFYDSHVRLDTPQKITLTIANAFCISIYLLIALSVLSEKPSGSDVAVLLFIAPAAYYFLLFRRTLWNIYGSEHIVIDTGTITVSRKYKLFDTPTQTIPYSDLYYRIIPHEHYYNKGNAVIEFLHHNEMGLQVIIFKSTIYVPTEQLEELVRQIGLIYSIRQLEAKTMRENSRLN